MEYTYDEYQHANGVNRYKITPSGTAYHIETPDDLVKIMEQLRENNTRVTFDFGDTVTGESWEEEFDITGRIGRSTGRIKIPLLIKTSRSWGGGAILDHCILSIKYANKKDGGIIYESPTRKQWVYDQTHFTAGISL